MDEVCETVFKFLGIPTHVVFYKKMIIANPQGILMDLIKSEIETAIHTFRIKDIIFIKDKTSLIYYRKRKAEGMKNFIRCEKTVKDGVFSEKRRQITLREYLSVKKLFAPNKFIKSKIRSCFMYKKNFFQIDEFNVKDTTFSVCVIQGHKDKAKVVLPPIL